MKKNYPSNSSNAAPTIGFRDKILLALFASVSLAFVLFYSFVPVVSHAELGTVAAAQSNPSVKKPAASSTNSVSTNTSLDPTGTAAAADVVSKALAFKALLTAQQQATLEQTYTTTLARRWSNLPCGSGCRNGIQFSTLTSEQLTAALAVIQAASGTAANEGYDEFNQIRAADAYLGVNGGGSGYSSGIYFIAFLNTPSTTGGWMLQFGGHHYAANIAYNNGRVVGATPEFRGVEPISFASNGTTYAPLTQERDALATMLASLSSAQLASARLSQTFSDVTLSPGESNGGSGTFPATKVGVAVSTLSDAQKLLVLTAIKPYTQDLDDTVAANLLTIYQNELNNTFISYTGSGTAGDASTFLNANTNYVRIDGTSVWIEFIVQTGAVFRNSIHYHTVYRDHTRDYGADLTLTTPLDTVAAPVSKTRFDFDNDNKADISIFRPSNGTWYVARSTAGGASTVFGQAGDRAVAADYDGDGTTDVAVWRPSNGAWYIHRSTAGFASVVFGLSGDVPAPGDYDGDGRADLAVFRPANGTWYIQRSTAGFVSTVFGLSGDVPVAADYDADGRADIGVFRPSNGMWYLQRSTAGFAQILFGLPGDRAVPADYDGDGAADVAVWRPSSGTWYIQRSTAGFVSTVFGILGDTPVPADYDGDNKADVAIWRPSNGFWYIQRSTAGFTQLEFGVSGDAPAPARDYSIATLPSAQRRRFDFDSDGRADVSIFRPSNGTWYLNLSRDVFAQIQFGLSGDTPVAADYDGDGRTDLAVWRPSNGVWYILGSANGYAAAQFGLTGDVPAPADYDGDGITDLAVFRPSNGTWYLSRSSAGYGEVVWGQAGDTPVAADYDADGRADIAVWRPSNGFWYASRSGAGFAAVAFGQTGDVPVAADYDADGGADIGVFRPSNGFWYLSRSSAGFFATEFGLNGDQPVPADYDADGRTDIGIFRRSNGTWYLSRSTSGFAAVQFGLSGDIAAPKPVVP